MTKRTERSAVMHDAAGAQVLDAIDPMLATAKRFELPAPAPEVTELTEKLRRNQHQVVVVGEAKRGKTTFINALIGSDLLPTDVGVATSQAFKVRRAEREGFRLRFEDDSAREITREELERYGSQAVIDRDGKPALDKLLRWIEVDTPARFLAPNIAFIDTPGLGALYAAHAQITHRFLPRADAVVVVLESSQPILENELALCERIAERTPNLFFVQTKIDQHSKEEWQATLERSEELLRQRLGDTVGELRVWPVSAANLRKAATSEEEDALLLVSRFEALEDALQAFLERISGAVWAADALTVAAREHATSAALLSSRLAALEGETGSAAERVRELREREGEFRRAWLDPGTQRAEVERALERSQAAARRRFAHAFKIGGTILLPLEERVQAAASTQELEALMQTLSEDLIEAALVEWQQIRAELEQQASEHLAGFLDTAELLAIPSDVALSEAVLGEWPAPLERLGVGDTVSQIAESVAAPLALVIALGLPVFAVAIGAVLAVVQQWGALERRRTNEGKAELVRGLRARAQELQQYLAADAGGTSRVEQDFEAIRSSALAFVDRVTRRQLATTAAEIERLEAESALEGQARTERAQRLRAQINEWNELGERLSLAATLPDIAEVLAERRAAQPVAMGKG